MIKNRISVRDLVAFCLTEGSLGSSVLTSTRALLGTNEHKRIQDARGDDYLKEFSLKTIIEKNGIVLEVYGRADGIFSKSTPPVIEEIKTTTSTEVQEKHLAQVKIYAYLYCICQSLEGVDLKSVTVKLLYIDINTKKEWTHEEELERGHLETFFNSFITPYLKYLQDKKAWIDVRNDSLKNLNFPFDNFRPGQREFSVEVYRAVRDGNTLIGRAPTGTGKSVATLFPALKSMGEGSCEKIFYLTAKTVGRITARETINLMRKKGAEVKSVVITAKEKICINREYNCSPDICPYARDYYKKLDKVISKLSGERDFYEDNLKKIGDKYTLCPFELSLDLSYGCDVIICDYNYVFDLRVQLKRYFESAKSEYCLLVDEAHNLPDRLRSSYSASIIREEVPSVVEIVKGLDKLTTDSLNELNSLLLKYSEELEGKYEKHNEVPAELTKIVRKFTQLTERELVGKDFPGKKVLLDFYYNSLFFIKLSELYTEGHIFLKESNGGLGITVTIQCLDPSILFTRMLLKSKSHILFSATLNPVNYYTSLLLDDREFNYVDIPSPFEKDRLQLVVRSDIKTTYKERARYFSEVAATIKDVISSKKGNYIVFFPSYAYMEEVKKLIDIPVHIQRSNMNENERKEYIDKFDSDNNVLSFAITGGIFGEGIDLVGDKLIGVIIVGVGLPQISVTGDLIKEHFNNKKCNGYNFAYTYPGFNRIMQGIGRVIRHEDDKGVAVLLDHRYNNSIYKNLFPQEWRGFKITNSKEGMNRILKDFWQ